MNEEERSYKRLRARYKYYAIIGAMAAATVKVLQWLGIL